LVISVEGSMENRLDPAMETALYGIVQEALTNVSKHARATRVDIRLQLDGKRIGCTIRDNGIGIDPSALRTERPGRAWA
jgi:signal transduction histidine kinase